jgi:hypothetical protein
MVHRSAVRNFFGTHKELSVFFSASVEYVPEKQIISSELVQNYLLGAEGVVMNMKPVTCNTKL